MYLYLGGEKCVNENEIIGIFDLDNVTVSVHSRNFINQAERENKTEYVNLNELPKSFILTESKVIISPISSATLLKRTNAILEF